MKRLSLPSEILLWVIALLPAVYLWLSWEQLPARVPVHFNLEGEANGWAGKAELAAVVLSTTLGINLLLLFIPAIDPKGRIRSMGSKYDALRIILVLFMVVFTFFIIHSAISTQSIQPELMLVLVGALLAVFGNYFQAIKPNYFIGIRTPWTLESDTVWRKTHRLSGRLWIVGGILIALLPLIPEEGLRKTIFYILIALLVLVPVGHSFIVYRQEKAVQ